MKNSHYYYNALCTDLWYFFLHSVWNFQRTLCPLWIAELHLLCLQFLAGNIGYKVDHRGWVKLVHLGSEIDECYSCGHEKRLNTFLSCTMAAPLFYTYSTFPKHLIRGNPALLRDSAFKIRDRYAHCIDYFGMRNVTTTCNYSHGPFLQQRYSA